MRAAGRDGRAARLRRPAEPAPTRSPGTLWVDFGLPLAGRAISPGWHEVGRFLGGSIRDFDERWPLPRLLTALREAGFEDVQARRLSLGGCTVALGPAHVTEARPAFYALAPGGWRDYVTLLHPPYTAWHLSYVVIGACLAPHLVRGPARGRAGRVLPRARHLARTRWTS